VLITCVYILWRVNNTGVFDVCRLFWHQICRVSGYPRQVIEVDASWTTTLYSAALTTVTTLITIILLGTYNSSSWYIFLWDDATTLVHLSSLMTAVCLSLSWLSCFAGLTVFHYWRLFYTVDLSLLAAGAECPPFITLDLLNRRHRFQLFGCWLTGLIVSLRDFSRQRSVVTYGSRYLWNRY
jgi:hypothetical protein